MIYRILKNFIRTPECISLRNYSQEGKIKCYGFTYYKRFPGDKDPPVEKAKLFRVQRVRSYRGAPYWEKNILLSFGLMKKKNEIAIVKNIPENNALLWKIKHLVKITPITFPYGEPTEEDIGATYLKENGEFLRSDIVKIDSEQLEASIAFANDISRMDGKTLKKQLRYQWLNPRINAIN